MVSSCGWQALTPRPPLPGLGEGVPEAERRAGVRGNAFCSIDVGVGGKVPFVVVCYRAVLKHECREGTKGTNWVQNDRAVVSLSGVAQQDEAVSHRQDAKGAKGS
jgi:hypothetical protein